MQIKSVTKQLTDAETLRNWLDYSVPRGEYNKQKKRMVEACLVSNTTFNNWLYGNCRIPEAGKRDINRVTMEFSGTEIFKIAKPESDTVGVSDVSSGEAIALKNLQIMKRVIKFGERFAIINIDANRALLTIEGTSLPVILADTLDRIQDVSITDVCLMDNNAYNIRIIHKLQRGELLDAVCETITQVYDVDASVSYERTKNAL